MVKELPKKGNYTEEEFYSIIVNSKGKPDLLAISLYSDIRSWFKLDKNGKSKLKANGYRTSYEELAKKYKVSKPLIKQKIVFLESLELLKRDFRREYICGQWQYNVLYLLVWKNTPYFYSEIGIEKTVTHPANLDKKTWENKHAISTGTIQKIEQAPVKKTEESPLENSHIIYSNTTLNTTLNNTDLSLDHNFSFSNQGEYEVQKDSNKETQLSRSRPLQEPQGVITSQVKQYSSQQAVATRDINGSYHNKLLKDFKFTDELLDTVRRLSNKPDISIDRIKAIIRNIVTNNPETEIWGGNKAFVNYVVRAVNNEKEYSKKGNASSIAEMDKKAREKAALMYENKTIQYFN